MAPVTGVPPRELATARLKLDAVVPGDAGDVLDYCSDPILPSFLSPCLTRARQPIAT